MIVGVGTDIVKLPRIARSYDKFGEGFAKRILAPQELARFYQLKNPVALLAKRFAIKEAAVKALGTGIGVDASWQDIYLQHDSRGAPQLCFQGRARAFADAKGVKTTHVSVSDEEDYAVAFVVLSG